jgi:hypothetical protein
MTISKKKHKQKKTAIGHPDYYFTILWNNSFGKNL